ncbi:MAG: putative RNA uridine N3 methyltransferase, partial [Acidilobaceae archaeon]
MTSPFEWPPRRRHRKLAVAFPASVLATEDTLELKTIKAGVIGRVLAVYRVDQAVLFMDPESREGDLKLLKLLLEYMVSPPHLRRKLYPITRELS